MIILHAPGKFTAIHLGHINICDQHVDPGILCAADFQSRAAIRGCQDAVIRQFENAADEQPDHGFIIGDEKCWHENRTRAGDTRSVTEYSARNFASQTTARPAPE